MGKPLVITVGIDPGASGAIAVVDHYGKIEAHAYTGESDLLETLRAIAIRSGLEGIPVECALEQVGGYIGKPQPGSAMFKFGQNYGFALGVLAALGLRHRLVRPQDWQRAVGLGSTLKGAPRKRALKEIAQRLRPELKVTLATADAILIAEWLRREVTRG